MQNKTYHQISSNRHPLATVYKAIHCREIFFIPFMDSFLLFYFRNHQKRQKILLCTYSLSWMMRHEWCIQEQSASLARLAAFTTNANATSTQASVYIGCGLRHRRNIFCTPFNEFNDNRNYSIACQPFCSVFIQWQRMMMLQNNTYPIKYILTFWGHNSIIILKIS